LKEKTLRRPGRPGRPTTPPESRAPFRPVLTQRVSMELYERVAEAARRSNRKLGEEAAHRVEQSFEWEKSFGDARKLLADTKKVIAEEERGDLEDQMRQAGFTCVHGIGGEAWFPPEVSSVAWIFDNSNRHVLEELLERAASRALAKMAAAKTRKANKQPEGEQS